MPRFVITATAEGSATLTIEAETEADAIEAAYSDHLTGIDIGCGVSNWNIESVEEIEDGDA